MNITNFWPIWYSRLVLSSPTSRSNGRPLRCSFLDCPILKKEGGNITRQFITGGRQTNFEWISARDDAGRMVNTGSISSTSCTLMPFKRSSRCTSGVLAKIVTEMNTLNSWNPPNSQTRQHSSLITNLGPRTVAVSRRTIDACWVDPTPQGLGTLHIAGSIWRRVTGPIDRDWKRQWRAENVTFR